MFTSFVLYVCIWLAVCSLDDVLYNIETYKKIPRE